MGKHDAGNTQFCKSNTDWNWIKRRREGTRKDKK